MPEWTPQGFGSTLCGSLPVDRWAKPVQNSCVVHYLKLTSINPQKAPPRPEPILINVDHIRYVVPDAQGGCLFFDSTAHESTNADD